jgi:HlyD family secretion protein
MPIVMLEAAATRPDGTSAPNSALEAIIYMSAAEGKKVKKGMSVEVAPSTVVREEYGAIIGTVAAVAEYPTSAEAITTRLGSRELASSFLQTIDTPLELRISLTLDSSTQSGYKWTSPKGPPETILQGTLCQAWVTTRLRAPISLVLPLFRVNP